MTETRTASPAIGELVKVRLNVTLNVDPEQYALDDSRESVKAIRRLMLARICEVPSTVVVRYGKGMDD